MESVILFVDHDLRMQSLITTVLENHGYRPVVTATGKDALQLNSVENCTAIILELDLPDMSGIQLIHHLRKETSIPILVLSSRKEDLDKIAALDAGADDYVTKPFSVEELLARLRASIRRVYQEIEEPQAFENGSLQIRFNQRCVLSEGVELHLTPIEYKLVCLLSRNVGKVLPHKLIMREVWGDTAGIDVTSLRVFMAALRKKIEAKSTEKMIETHVGIGYRMNKL